MHLLMIPLPTFCVPILRTAAIAINPHCFHRTHFWTHAVEVRISRPFIIIASVKAGICTEACLTNAFDHTHVRRQIGSAAEREAWNESELFAGGGVL